MTSLSPELEQAVHSLNQALKDSPPFRAYGDALTRMAEDQSATRLLDELEDLQSKLQLHVSGAGQADAARLPQLQTLVQSHPAIANFLAANLTATGYLLLLNQFISGLLGIDVASFGRARACCQE